MASDEATGPGEPFVHDYLAYLLARASYQVSQEFHREVERAGLSVPEWRVLATLSRGGAITLGELAETVLAKQPTVTKLVIRMEVVGLVSRAPGTTDRRQALVNITAAGRTRVDGLLQAAKKHEARVLADLGADEARALKEVLRRLISGYRPRRGT
jgi:DNA-binding MarR family transcriptional regulator